MCDEYAKFVANAIKLINEPPLDFLSAQQKQQFLDKQIGKAKKQCQQAIELNPKLPAAHHALGCALEGAGDFSGAASSFLSAVELADAAPDSESVWAESATRAYTLLANAPQVSRPVWWEDESLLSMSLRAVTCLADNKQALRWRAEILSGRRSALPVPAPREALQLREASGLFQRVAKLVSSKDKEERKAAIEASAACLADAERAEAVGHVETNESEMAASGSKNAAKNRKKKEKAKQKQIEQLLNEEEPEAAGSNSSTATTAAELTAEIDRLTVGSADRSAADSIAAAAGTQAAAEMEEATTAATCRGDTLPEEQGGDGVQSTGPQSTREESRQQVSGKKRDKGKQKLAAASNDSTGYCWVSPLPVEFAADLLQSGVIAGAPVTDVDLSALEEHGGPAAAIEVGLIQALQVQPSC